MLAVTFFREVSSTAEDDWEVSAPCSKSRKSPHARHQLARRPPYEVTGMDRKEDRITGRSVWGFVRPVEPFD